MNSADQTNAPDADQPALPETRVENSDLKMGRAAAVGLAILGGCLLVLVCIAVFPIFRLPLRLAAPFPPPEVAIEREQVRSWDYMMNAIFALGLFGALVGGLLATGESIAQGLRARRILNILLAIIAGAALGVASGALGHYLSGQLKLIKTISPMGSTVIVQMVTLAVLGIGIGIGSGLAAGGRRAIVSQAILGAVAGLLAGLLFLPACALAAPLVKTGAVVPGGVVDGREEWIGLVIWAGLMALSIGLLLPNARRRKKQ